MGIHAFFVDPVEEELCCQICYRPLEKPVTHCTQGHTYCRPCIRQWLERPQAHKPPHGSSKTAAPAPHCPGCMLPMGPEVRNIVAENMISKLRVRCRNCSEQGDGRVCEWVGRLEELQHHCMVKCEYEQVECAHAGCSFSDWRCHVREHQASCAHRRVECSLQCGWKGKALDEGRHLGNDCPLVVLGCINQGCGERFERRESGAHYDRECQFQPVDCVFATHGCRVRPLRKDQAHHQAEAAVEHASLTSQKISVLEQSMDKVLDRFEELRRRVEQSERTTRETIVSLVANPTPGIWVVLYSRIRSWHHMGLLQRSRAALGDDRLSSVINLFLEGLMSNVLLQQQDQQQQLQQDQQQQLLDLRDGPPGSSSQNPASALLGAAAAAAAGPGSASADHAAISRALASLQRHQQHQQQQQGESRAWMLEELEVLSEDGEQ